jgi:hypothetical protein
MNKRFDIRTVCVLIHDSFKQHDSALLTNCFFGIQLRYVSQFAFNYADTQGAMNQYAVRPLWRAAVAMQLEYIVLYVAHRQCSIENLRTCVLS